MWSLLRDELCGKSYTLNFDGSHNNQNNKSGAGCIIRDNQGEFKLAASYCLTQTYPDDCNVAIAEAEALLNGLKLAKEYNLKINIIRGDSKEVIDHVLGHSRRPAKPPLSQIINQIIGMVDRFSQTIEVVDREANKVADKLAYWGSSRVFVGRKLYTSYADLPPQVGELIEQDKSSCNKMKQVESGEGSSMASNLAMGAAAIGGIGLLALGVSKLFGSTQIKDFHTLNFDGSDINQQKKGGAGCIIRNKDKELVIAAAYNLDNCTQLNVAIAEALALRNGLNLAKNYNIKLDMIEGDSQEVIDRVRGKEKNSSKVPILNELISEIREALFDQSIDPISQLQLIGREANKVADELASIGAKLGVGREKIYDRDAVLTTNLDQFIEEDKSVMGPLNRF